MKNALILHEDLDLLDLDEKAFHALGYNAVMVRDKLELAMVLGPAYDLLCVSYTAWASLTDEMKAVLMERKPELYQVRRVNDEYGLLKENSLSELMDQVQAGTYLN